MRSLYKEKRTVWVSSYESKEQVVEDGMLTGEWVVRHTPPFPIEPTLSPNGGNVYADGFGYGVSYDRTLIIHGENPGITESSVLWVDREPVTDEDGELVTDANGDPVVPWDYTVSSVAESLYVTNVALRKAE